MLKYSSYELTGSEIIETSVSNNFNKCFSWSEEQKIVTRMMSTKVDRYSNKIIDLIFRDGSIQLTVLNKVSYHKVVNITLQSKEKCI
jgi:hypothetical protein